MCNGPLYIDSLSTFQLLRNYSRIDMPADFNRSHNLTTVKSFERNSSIISSQSSSVKPNVALHSNINHGTICVNRSSGSKRMKNSQPFSTGSRARKSLENNCFANLVQPQVNNVLSIDKGDSHKIASNNNNFQHPEANSLSMLAKNSGDSSTFEFEHLQCILNRRQRGEKRPIPDEQKDEKYFERRKRNNEAAKKSRDARKMREDRIALRAALLEQENAILKAQIFALREELLALQQMICNRANI